jgi:glycosyltransferase involved in cell wall biosynthesis
MTNMPLEVSTAALPSVSVIVPCYNQGEYLNDALLSAEHAYRGPLEVIVVDDGSTAPRTLAALRRLQPVRATLHVIRQPNGGLSSARNAGLARATGEYIQFLDADDLLVPRKIDRQVDHFAVVPRLDVSISDYMLCDEQRLLCSNVESMLPTSRFELSDFLFRWERGLSIPIHCGLFRRAALAGIRFDELLRAKEDWLFWSTLKIRDAKMAYLPVRGAVYRQHAQSMRRSYRRMGDSWLCAAAKIRAALPGDAYPAFLDEAVSWHAKCYRAHPHYAAELAESAGPDTAATVESHTESTPSASNANDETAAENGLASRFAGMAVLSGPPLITVVIPVYNHYDYLIECLGSLIDQAGAAFEVICIDDASTDARVGRLLDTLEGVSPRLRILRRAQNTGISENQNEAVRQALGDYIAFLDCDDALLDSALQRVISEIAAHPEVDYFFTDRFDIDERGEVIRRAHYGGYPDIVPSADSDIRSDLLDGMVASHLKVIRRTAYERAGGTSSEFSGIQDWELALRIAEFGKFRHIAEPLYRHRIHAASVSRSDSQHQFRKSNLLRRQYQLKWLAPAQVDKTVMVFQDAKLPTPKELKALWQRGQRCHVEIGRQCSPVALNFLREFNSYFEQISYEDIGAWVALMGYTWGDILRGASGDNGSSAPATSHDTKALTAS